MNCINLVKQRLLTVQTPEMTRATQAFLSSMSKYHVSLGPWSVGIDKESSDILFSVPADSLKFVSGNFLKSLRCSWIESGFTIVEEAEVVGSIILLPILTSLDYPPQHKPQKTNR